jgi:predicted TIM-barrel fold metal-dependent hydrolase
MANIDQMVKGGSGKRTERGAATLLPEPDPEPLWCPVISVDDHLPVISVDDHLVEPLTLFEGRVPQRMAADAPKVEFDADGVPAWCIAGERFPITVPNGAIGRPMSEWTSAPAKLDEFRAGVSDPLARTRDMDLAGVWASVAFPSLIWGFAGSRFLRTGDDALGLACLRAYNDWMMEDWVGAAPSRLIGNQLPWLGDPAVAATEIRRNAARGCRAVSFSENPEPLGLPSLHTGWWDPFLDACEETGTVVNLHVGGSGTIQRPSSDSPSEVATTLFPVNSMIAVVDWIYARIPIKFPHIKLVLSEGGVSWVPTILERLRRAYDRVEASTAWSSDDPDPCDLLHENFWFASIDDPSAFHQLDLIGEDRVLMETDYPHPDSSWPGCQELVRSQLEHLSAATIRKICFGNAAHLYGHPEPPVEMVARSALGRL